LFNYFLIPKGKKIVCSFLNSLIQEQMRLIKFHYQSKCQKWVIYFILVISLTQSPITSFAQIDTEFWFVAPEVSINHGDRPIYLRISTLNSNSQVTISQPANAGFSPITQFIPANQVVTIDLTSAIDLIENKPAGQILNKGILITATAPIMAYYEVASSVNPEIFPLKAKNALGTLFYVPSQYSRPNQLGSEAFDIVATENNTLVTITPTITIEGRSANVPFTITLQKGQSFSARAIDVSPSASLSGSKISANRPIAVTISDDSILLGSGYDLIGDQLVPINLLGNAHIVIRGESGIGEEVYILATENQTEVSIAGVLVATLNAGQSYRHSLSQEMIYIFVNKPSYVYHISGHPNELGSALIPPIGCTGSKQMGFFRSSTGAFALMILTQNGNQNSFTLNGSTNLITAADFKVVPNTNNKWVAMYKNFSTSQIPANVPNVIRNSKGLFHMGILNDLGGSSEYGYFSDYSSLDIGPASLTACENTPVILDAGFGKESYEWSDGTKGQTLEVKQSGKYWVKVKNGDCELYDEINVRFLSLPVVKIQNLPNQFCLESNPVRLQSNQNGGVFTIKGQTVSSFEPAVWGIGEHEVIYTYTNFENCTNSTSQKVRVNPPPTLAFSNLNEGYCIETPSFKLSAIPSGGIFRINNQVAQEFAPQKLGIGTHRVTYAYLDENGCQNSIQQLVEVVAKPSIMIITDSIFLCPANREGVELKATGGNFFKWNTNETQATIFVNKTGKYSVTVSNGFGCETVNNLEVFLKCTPIFIMPNAFSPNQDGLNDVIKVVGKDIYNLNLQIYNRWGEIVFISNYKDEVWDGTFKGKDVPAGTYIWVATYGNIQKPEEKYKKQGKINLIR
jgi:gliding motility-associated-like protein